ncbi:MULTISPECIES: hypothetical protein [unclassified Haloferax]|uniref:hypothetical protein n=1 Tax=Haloferax TaxID=2251 RepID=UPI000E27DA11|nr:MULTISPECIES: hypothetical protein [unclassified Haloferax]RDZ38033.1 hypothetical protein C5B88_08045 [Haloferax sp. Atlit-24N]RLM38829.1 hypothetical protein DVK03_08050 [Haloferax sp. Atlit-109R]RLM46776.1 hypothetical protein DVK04_08065 [Haloferax sp. Atlit-105R]
MVPPRTRTTLLSLLSVLALAGTAAAQNFDSAPQLSPVFRAGGSFLIDLVVGGILVAVAPAYTRDAIAEIRDDPGGSFLWGLGVSIGGVIVLVLLAITIIGLLVAIPGFLALVLLSIVGGAVSTVFLGSLVTGTASGGSPPLGVSVAVGALVAAILSLVPILGSVILFVVDMLGLGVVGRNLVRSWT